MTIHSTPQTFKDQHRELQELVREHHHLRNHNGQFKEGDLQGNLFMFAEASLICVIMERFVRVVLGPDATDKDTLHNLLQKAVSKRLLRVPWKDQEEGIRKVKAVRNTLLHGNYEQAAKEANCASVREYFRSQFAGEIELMFQITDDLMRQIDPETGRPLELT